jgi:ElaB/YqjD/DUF883 family membrane-anchored ribosome-binding protein
MRNGEIKNVERTSTMNSRIAEAVRYATECSTDARRLTAQAQEALQDRLDETARALKVVKRRVEDFEDVAARYVKREPVKALAITAGAALAIGLMVGRFARPKRRKLFGAVV